MKATFKAPRLAGKNLSGDKELVRALSVVAKTRRGLREAVTVRWWMGRRADGAGKVYCTIWTHGDGFDAAGHGSASGFGYHKASAALDSAIRAAGIELSERRGIARHIDGAGDGACEEAVEAIARAMGYTGELAIIRHG